MVQNGVKWYIFISFQYFQYSSLLILDVLASLGSMLEGQSVGRWEMLSTLGHIIRVCSDYVQSVFRVFRVCSECVSFHHLAHLVCQFLAYFSVFPIKPVLTRLGAKFPPELWSWGNMSPFQNLCKFWAKCLGAFCLLGQNVS